MCSLFFFFFKQKTAYEITRWLEFRRVLFRSLTWYLWCLKNIKSLWLWKVITWWPLNCGSWGKSDANILPTVWPSLVLKLFSITSGMWELGSSERFISVYEYTRNINWHDDMGIVFMYVKFLRMLFIHHSVKIWWTVQHSVKSTESWWYWELWTLTCPIGNE